MFLKPYKIKSNSPLKGSEVKRFRQRLETAYSHITTEQFQTLMPARANATLLKIITHKQSQINLYCIEKLPYFFELEFNVLVPTVYALWQVPELLPYFTTWSDVFPKLNNGANLMLAGVIPQGTGLRMYGHYKKDQLIAINLTTNTAAYGVGRLARSSDDLYMCGGRGPAVIMLHILGDKLWSHEPTLTQQVPMWKPAALTEQDFPELGAKVTKQTNTNNTLTDSNDIEKKEVETVDNELSEDIKEMEIKEDTENTAEVLLKRGFLAALKNHGKSLPLPLLTSNFYRVYMVPEISEPIDLKKTRYKKLSNFLNEMIEQGFIVVREETKGVDKIMSINLEHPELMNFITDFKSSDANNEQNLFHSSLTELYVITDATAGFFTKMNYKRGEPILATQIKLIVRDYISKFQLPMADAGNGIISLDETLEQICKRKQATKVEICKAIINRMEQSYQLCTAKDVSAKGGIRMWLATRKGNKKVTLIKNLEKYGIIMPEFIKLCKQGAAASATIVKLPHEVTEILQIQGNQINFVYTLLTETYKVPTKSIFGLEFAKKEKKDKKIPKKN